jgi:hypothetical protein
VFCPVSLYGGIVSAQGVADQQAAIAAWAALALALDSPGWPEVWKGMSWALLQRADDLGVPYPVPDDASELAAP